MLVIVSKWTDLLDVGVIRTENGVIKEANTFARAMGFEEGRSFEIPQKRILETRIGECEVLVHEDHVSSSRKMRWTG